MKLGIILQSNKPEHAWNTFRLGITALKANHQVEIFLMNEGSELDTIPDSEHFDISKKVAEFKELKGIILACGTCLEIRGKKEATMAHNQITEVSAAAKGAVFLNNRVRTVIDVGAEEGRAIKINAAARDNGLTYSKLINQLKKNNLKVVYEKEFGLLLAPLFSNVLVLFFDALDKIFFSTKGEIGKIGSFARSMVAPIIILENKIPIDFGYTLIVKSINE